MKRVRRITAALWVAAFVWRGGKTFAEGTNGFPDINVVLEGRGFASDFERDVFFLRRIRERYAAQWPALLGVNLTVENYIFAPEKMRRFVAEVGAAGEGSDDAVACTNLAVVVCDAEFYANTNAWRPELQEAAARSLMEIGPRGRRALAEAFNQTHYRTDPESLETLAGAMGESGVADSNYPTALAATAFTFTTANGGSYPHCTEAAVTNLLCLTNGAVVLRSHLGTNEVLGDPGRFQAVVDGMAAAKVDALAADLEGMLAAVKGKLAGMAPGPDPYRDDLAELQRRIEKAVERLRPAMK